MTDLISREAAIALIVFLLWWIVAHLAYAFVMMEWSWLTEWEPISRGLNLAASLYAAFGSFGIWKLGKP